jgi:hypothetical protein
LRLKRCNAQKKEGEPCRYNIIIFIKYLFSIGGSSCATGAICRGIIRNRRARDYNSRHGPWVDPAQSVAISGVIMECKTSVDGWSYRVKADDTRRNIIWVPEARVHRLEAALFNFRKAQVASTHILYRKIMYMIHSLVPFYFKWLNF